MGIYDELANIEKVSPTSKTPVKKKREQKASQTPPQQMQERTRAPMRTQTKAPKDARTYTHIYERIRRRVIQRSRLGGFTFRYQREELDRLDELVAALNKNQPLKVSKNDVVRIALNWLLEDYEENKSESVLAKVLARMRR